MQRAGTPREIPWTGQFIVPLGSLRGLAEASTMCAWEHGNWRGQSSRERRNARDLRILLYLSFGCPSGNISHFNSISETAISSMGSLVPGA
jgi:hypothetical protein